MYRGQSGFTLIELIMVIVILGILAATALPKFVDLSGDAERAAVDGFAGAITSASSINYAKYQVNSSAATALTGNTACTTLVNAGLVTGITLGTDFTITSDADCTTPEAGETATCTLDYGDGTPASGSTATATVFCTG